VYACRVLVENVDGDDTMTTMTTSQRWCTAYAHVPLLQVGGHDGVFRIPGSTLVCKPFVPREAGFYYCLNSLTMGAALRPFLPPFHGIVSIHDGFGWLVANGSCPHHIANERLFFAELVDSFRVGHHHGSSRDEAPTPTPSSSGYASQDSAQIQSWCSGAVADGGAPCSLTWVAASLSTPPDLDSLSWMTEEVERAVGEFLDTHSIEWDDTNNRTISDDEQPHHWLAHSHQSLHPLQAAALHILQYGNADVTGEDATASPPASTAGGVTGAEGADRETFWSRVCLQRHMHSFGRHRMPLYSVLEDLTSHMRRPCVLDIKIGFRQHGVGVSQAKRERMIAKCQRSTSRTLAARICGMKRYEVSTGAFVVHSKYEGLHHDAHGFANALRLFLHNGERVRVELIPMFVDKLCALIDVLRCLPAMRFFSSSLLLLYEGDVAGPALCDVRMIDFAHAVMSVAAPVVGAVADGESAETTQRLLDKFDLPFLHEQQSWVQEASRAPPVPPPSIMEDPESDEFLPTPDWGYIYGLKSVESVLQQLAEHGGGA
jgi:hypothetical protein